MTPYAVSVGDITKEDLALLELATSFVVSLPDFPPAIPVLSCHDVCDLWIRRGHPGTHVRGTWAGPFSHSWIALPSGTILDLYPVAATRPALFARTPIANPYRPL